MSEIDDAPRSYSGALLGAIALALVCAVASLIWLFALNSRLATQQAELVEAKQDGLKLAAELRETDARLRVATDELGKSLGLTQKQMDARANEVLRREQVEEASRQKLESAQQQTAQQVSAVTTEVSGVKTDLSKTQSDLANAVSQLTSMKGDMSDHASLIARNHDELETLKHRGDRSYYEFTLTKGQKKPVGTISLELRKADPKKNTFNLDVISDDKTVPKNNRGVNEPLQFYSGKEPMLFEVVVNSIGSKNQISGYLSAPKNAPAPPTAQ